MGETLTFLLVMILIGCFVLIPVFTMIRVESTTASQLKLVEVIDISMWSDRINSSSGLPRVRVKRPDRVDSRERLDR